MSLLGFLGIDTAFADTAIHNLHQTTGAHPAITTSMFEQIAFFAAIILIFYFLLHRPQANKAKAQKQMQDDLKIGDEIVTLGGIVGSVVKVTEGLLSIRTNGETEILFQKAAVASILPTGTMESIK